MEISNGEIVKKSLISALINGVINAGISGASFYKQDSVPLTLDHISNEEVTVFGQGVMLAFFLTVILAGINFVTVAKEIRKADGEAAFPYTFWPWGAKLALRTALTAFGSAMVVAIFWQRFIGTVMVSPLVGTGIMFVIAFLFTVYSSVATTNAMVSAQKSK